MKKRLLALLLCVVMVLGSLAGCANKNNTDNDANNNTNNEVNADNNNDSTENESGEDEGETEDETGKTEDETENEDEGSKEEESDDTEDEADSNTGSNEDSNSGSTDSNTGSNSGSTDSNAGSNSGSTDSNTGSNSGSTDSESKDKTFTVTITSEAGRKLSNVDVEVYKDGKAFKVNKKAVKGKTNENGVVEFTLPNDGTYTIKLDKKDLPAGYIVEKEYTLTSGTTAIVADIQLQADVPASIKVGDAMFDFTVTTLNGETITLSKLIGEKDLVVITFWTTWCTYCDMEVPYMSEAYQQYKDNMEVLALNPYDSAEAASKHPSFANSPFKLALSKGSWFNAFNTGSYPTTVLIDRYGVVCEVINGAYDTVEAFSRRFATYVGDNYTQVLHP